MEQQFHIILNDGRSAIAYTSFIPRLYAGEIEIEDLVIVLQVFKDKEDLEGALINEDKFPNAIDWHEIEDRIIEMILDEDFLWDDFKKTWRGE